MSLLSGVFTRTRSKSILQVNIKPKDSVGTKKSLLPAVKNNPNSGKATSKRKRVVTPSKQEKKPKLEDSSKCQDEEVLPRKKTKIEITGESGDLETRSRVFRKWAPKSYLERLSRATSQR